VSEADTVSEAAAGTDRADQLSVADVGTDRADEFSVADVGTDRADQLSEAAVGTDRADRLSVAILGPGGVGGFLAAALDRAGTPVEVIARESTVALIAEHGLQLRSVRFGTYCARVRARAQYLQKSDVLIVATKATALAAALDRVRVAPRLVLPLLNGLDHLRVLRERFDPSTVAAGAIRIEADRPEPGVVVHTSPFLRVDMAAHDPSTQPLVEALARELDRARVPARVLDSEAQVIWSKLVRLNALACTTSAFDKLLGEIRDTPALREQLHAAIDEGAAVARAEGAQIEAATVVAELNDAHATLGSSMQRDIAAGRTPELDAIPGAVLRAAARHDLGCPTIERLTGMIAARAGIPAPVR
jgi:2-dehydropantoate 2-reductase